VQSLGAEEHPFKTLVVDSVTALASLIEGEVIASDPKQPKSINQALGGYGAGLNACAERHRLFVEQCKRLNEDLGMTIVFVAHSVVENVEPPDADPYTRYTLRADKRVQTYYLDTPDMVAFVRLKTKYITKENTDKVRAVTDQLRVIVAHPTGAHVSKNRYGITSPVDWPDLTANPLVPFLPFFAEQQAAAPARRRRGA
jgi:hypothetical protein